MQCETAAATIDEEYLPCNAAVMPAVLPSPTMDTPLLLKYQFLLSVYRRSPVGLDYNDTEASGTANKCYISGCWLGLAYH